MQNIDTIDTVYAIDSLAAETGQATATISDLVKLIQATYALANESDVIKYFDLVGLVGATYDARVISSWRTVNFSQSSTTGLSK